MNRAADALQFSFKLTHHAALTLGMFSQNPPRQYLVISNLSPLCRGKTWTRIAIVQYLDGQAMPKLDSSAIHNRKENMLFGFPIRNCSEEETPGVPRVPRITLQHGSAFFERLLKTAKFCEKKRCNTSENGLKIPL
jgi:hypothetical protein